MRNFHFFKISICITKHGRVGNTILLIAYQMQWSQLLFRPVANCGCFFVGFISMWLSWSAYILHIGTDSMILLWIHAYKCATHPSRCRLVGYDNGEWARCVPLEEAFFSLLLLLFCLNFHYTFSWLIKDRNKNTYCRAHATASTYIKKHMTIIFWNFVKTMFLPRSIFRSKNLLIW